MRVIFYLCFCIGLQKVKYLSIEVAEIFVEFLEPSFDVITDKYVIELMIM